MRGSHLLFADVGRMQTRCEAIAPSYTFWRRRSLQENGRGAGADLSRPELWQWTGAVDSCGAFPGGGSGWDTLRAAQRPVWLIAAGILWGGGGPAESGSQSDGWRAEAQRGEERGKRWPARGRWRWEFRGHRLIQTLWRLSEGAPRIQEAAGLIDEAATEALRRVHRRPEICPQMEQSETGQPAAEAVPGHEEQPQRQIQPHPHEPPVAATQTVTLPGRRLCLPQPVNHFFPTAAHSSLNCDVIRRTDSAILPRLTLCLQVTKNVLTVMSFLLTTFTCHSVK